MPKTLIRILAVLLIPCLVVDPGLAAGFTSSHSTAIHFRVAPSAFFHQALVSPLVARFLGRSYNAAFGEFFGLLGNVRQFALAGGSPAKKSFKFDMEPSDRSLRRDDVDSKSSSQSDSSILQQIERFFAAHGPSGIITENIAVGDRLVSVGMLGKSMPPYVRVGTDAWVSRDLFLTLPPELQAAAPQELIVVDKLTSYSRFPVPFVAALQTLNLQHRIASHEGAGSGLVTAIALAHGAQRVLPIENEIEELKEAQKLLIRLDYPGERVDASAWWTHRPEPHQRFVLIPLDLNRWLDAPAYVRRRVSGGTLTVRLAHVSPHFTIHRRIIQSSLEDPALESVVIGGYDSPSGERHSKFDQDIAEFVKAHWKVTPVKYETQNTTYWAFAATRLGAPQPEKIRIDAAGTLDTVLGFHRERSVMRTPFGRELQVFVDRINRPIQVGLAAAEDAFYPFSGVAAAKIAQSVVAWRFGDRVTTEKYSGNLLTQTQHKHFYLIVTEKATGDRYYVNFTDGQFHAVNLEGSEPVRGTPEYTRWYQGLRLDFANLKQLPAIEWESYLESHMGLSDNHPWQHRISESWITDLVAQIIATLTRQDAAVPPSDSAPHASVDGPEAASLAPFIEWFYSLPFINLFIYFMQREKGPSNLMGDMFIPKFIPVTFTAGMLFLWGWWGTTSWLVHLVVTLVWAVISGNFFAEVHTWVPTKKGKNWLFGVGTALSLATYTPVLWPSLVPFFSVSGLSALGTGLLFNIALHYLHYRSKLRGLLPIWAPHASFDETRPDLLPVAPDRAAIRTQLKPIFASRVKDILEDRKIELEDNLIHDVVNYLYLPIGNLWGSADPRPQTASALQVYDEDAWNDATFRLRGSLATQTPLIQAAQQAARDLIELRREWYGPLEKMLGQLHSSRADFATLTEELTSFGLLPEEIESMKNPAAALEGDSGKILGLLLAATLGYAAFHGNSGPSGLAFLVWPGLAARIVRIFRSFIPSSRPFLQAA